MTNLVTQEKLADIEWRATRLVDAVTGALAVPGRRAVLRRSLGRVPQDPAVARAHGLIAPYLPMLPDPVRDGSYPDTAIDAVAIERAFYTVAALIAAQPRSARDAEIAATDVDASVPPDGTAQPTAAESRIDAAATPDADVTADPTPALSTSAGSGRRRPSLGFTLGAAVRAGKLNGETLPPRLHLLCRQDVAGVHRHLPRLVGQLRSDLVPVAWVPLIVDLARWGRYRDQVAKGWLQDYYRTVSARPAAPSPTTSSADIPTGGVAADSESETS
ncbi:type I-E CRISPR-associated protein Cse2/CasB [Frankia gtarii]|uniref:type I-E CRISPR-associated protein Cse2/CasB n=1 Tax=Frankia gtarii TaxID=2950102 RepID=UPI0021C0CA5B|nr:type I-E CRISPR-associated protein Cse2/CasB [Frankia gtarii]